MKLNEKAYLNRVGEILVFLAISALLIGLFSFSTSPLFNADGMDSAIFRMLGRLTHRGYLPYRDFFDHKGPFIITVEWLGCIISENRIGIYIVQVLFSFASLYFSFKLFLLKYSRKTSFLLSFITILFLVIFYEGGNYTEEFCLPFIVASLYLFSKFALDENKEIFGHLYKYSFFYGITFVVCAFTRLTNAFPIVCIWIVLFVFLLRNKLMKNLFINVLWFVLGIAALSLPYIVYYASKGALYDMVYATFIYNLKHGSDYSTLNSNALLIKKILYLIILVWTLFVGIIATCKRSKTVLLGWCIIGMSLVGIVFHMKMRFYLHYYIIYIPIVLVSVLCLREIKNNINVKDIVKKILLVGTTCVTFFVCFKMFTGIMDTRQMIMSRNDNKLQKEQRIDIVKGVSSKDSIFCYDVAPQFYIDTNIDPCYRNFILQDGQTEYDKELREGFEKDLYSLKAKYIVVSKKNNNRYSKYINSHYYPKKVNNTYILFERK